MVKGLELFKNHFKEHTDQYVVIGGTACTVLLEEAGLNFRATKDLDIVLCIEALRADFSHAFWDFVKAGGYQHRQQSTGKDIYYRFSHPSNIEYPSMLELFCRQPNAIKIPHGCHLTPIPIEDSSVSLSAILLNNDYYDFIHAGKIVIDGLSLLNADHLIPIKSRAWIDLRERKNSGEEIDEKNIRKHRNDIFRLYQLLNPTQRISLPESISQDVKQFLSDLKFEDPRILKNLELGDRRLEDILTNLKAIYNISHTT